MKVLSTQPGAQAATTIGMGYIERNLSEDEIASVLQQAFTTWDLSGQRVLVIIPDGTRSAPIPLFFRLFERFLGGKTAALDYLVALGTHQPMSEAALNHRVGLTPEERTGRYAHRRIFNHRWEQPNTFVEIGKISAEESAELTRGKLAVEVAVRVNRLVMEYDILLVCGPVFPHEVVGFSGGSKYFFPGISGPEVINYTHWLGALITSYEIIGSKHTPVREVIERVAEMISTPKLCVSLVVHGAGLAGVYVGEPRPSWSAAADLSASVHVHYVERPYQQVLSVIPKMYADLWTGAKGMYKLEPVVADGGEVILYAPHITEISYTHGPLIEQVGYHVRDYFVDQWERFKDIPWGILAHSTHLRGIGSYAGGIERPRIQVTLATGIPRQRCEAVCLGYLDPAAIHLEDWEGREAEGRLFVPQAGEMLYRLSGSRPNDK